MGKPNPLPPDRRPIDGCPGYFISPDGTVWSTNPHRVKPGQFRPIKPKRYKQLSREYLRVRLRVAGKDSQHYVAVLVLTAFAGPRPGAGFTAQYRDGNPLNCTIDNLYWGETNSATISLQDFIRAWQESTSIREVVERTGMTYSGVQQRGMELRKRGVPLKKMARDGADWDALAEYARKLLEGEQ